MQYIPHTLYVIVLFTICYANSGDSGPDESLEYVYLSRKEACPILKKELKSAKKEVSKDESFREYLISRNVIIQPDEPAYAFLTGKPVRDDVLEVYHNSEIVFELSKKYAEYLYRNNPPRSRNINPLLRKHSCCVEDFFAKFCVSNRYYKCTQNKQYRTINGLCTNLYCPKECAANTAFTTLLHQNYDDSISMHRTKALTNKRLPSPRVLSNKFFDQCPKTDVFLDDGPSVAGIQFGKLLAQDSVGSAVPRGSPILTCCKRDYSTILPKTLLSNICDPIRIPKDDKFFGPRGMTCMNFYRAPNIYDDNCVLSSRKQINIVTSYIDMSHIYGTTQVVADSTRQFVDGLLKTNAANLFPEDENGDFILIDNVSLASPVATILNIVFLREHNRIARDLKSKFPIWNDEKLYQEARRWNIAQYQVMTLKWIDIFVPQQYKHVRPRIKHDDTHVSSATLHEFGQASLRLIHKIISETIQLFDENGDMVDETYFSDANAFEYIRTKFANLARSLFYQKPNYNGCLTQMRNQAFKNAAGVGIDVLAYDIKRGRDDGLQPFYKYVKLCLNKKIKAFSDLAFLFSNKHIQQLEEVYDSVYDIDLFMGMMLEKRPKIYQFGPIASCITNEQIYRYRYGDPFFYDNPDSNYPFTSAQIAEIRKASFSRILCDNGDISEVAKDAFWVENGNNPMVDCASVPVVNIVY